MRATTSDTALNIMILIGIIGLLWFHASFDTFDKSGLTILMPQPDSTISQGNITIENTVEHIVTTTVTRKYTDNGAYIVVTAPFNDTYILTDTDTFRSVDIGKRYNISYTNTTDPVRYILPAD